MTKRKQNLLQITEQEWEYVEKYIEMHGKDKPVLKLRHEDHVGHIRCSFIVINGEPIALSSDAVANASGIVHLGKGNYGKVKLGQLRNSKNVAIKIQVFNKNSKPTEEHEALKERDEFYGSIIRENTKINKDKYFGKIMIDKLYTVQEYHLGNNLYDEIKRFEMNNYNMFLGLHNVKTRDKLIKYIIAFKIAEQIKTLHDKNILHRDIKPENFLLDVVNNEILIITVIDLGFAKILKKDDKEILGGFCGSTPYFPFFRQIDKMLLKNVERYELNKQKYKQENFEYNKTNDDIESYKKDLVKSQEKFNQLKEEHAKLKIEQDSLKQQERKLRSSGKKSKRKYKKTCEQCQAVSNKLTNLCKDLARLEKTIEIFKAEIDKSERKKERHNANMENRKIVYKKAKSQVIKYTLQKEMRKKEVRLFPYTKGTDIYSLGCILEDDLKIDRRELQILKLMLSHNDKERPSIERVLESLKEKIVGLNKQYAIKNKVIKGKLDKKIDLNELRKEIRESALLNDVLKCKKMNESAALSMAKDDLNILEGRSNSNNKLLSELCGDKNEEESSITYKRRHGFINLTNNGEKTLKGKLVILNNDNYELEEEISTLQKKKKIFKNKIKKIRNDKGIKRASWESDDDSEHMKITKHSKASLEAQERKRKEKLNEKRKAIVNSNEPTKLTKEQLKKEINQYIKFNDILKYEKEKKKGYIKYAQDEIRKLEGKNLSEESKINFYQNNDDLEKNEKEEKSCFYQETQKIDDLTSIKKKTLKEKANDLKKENKIISIEVNELAKLEKDYELKLEKLEKELELKEQQEEKLQIEKKLNEEKIQSKQSQKVEEVQNELSQEKVDNVAQTIKEDENANVLEITQNKELDNLKDKDEHKVKNIVILKPESNKNDEFILTEKSKSKEEIERLFYYAAWMGNIEKVKLYLKYFKFSLEELNYAKFVSGHSTIRIMLTNRIKFKVQVKPLEKEKNDKIKNSSLFYAAWTNEFKKVELLLDCFDYSKDDLEYAIYVSSQKNILSLLKKKLKLTFNSQIALFKDKQKKLEKMLCLASLENNFEKVADLLNFDFENSLLSKAKNLTRCENIKKLLNLRENLIKYQYDEDTKRQLLGRNLCLAVKNKNKQLVDYLLKNFKFQSSALQYVKNLKQDIEQDENCKIKVVSNRNSQDKSMSTMINDKLSMDVNSNNENKIRTRQKQNKKKWFGLSESSVFSKNIKLIDNPNDTFLSHFELNKNAELLEKENDLTSNNQRECRESEILKAARQLKLK